MKLKLAFTWSPGTPETIYSYKDSVLTVDDFSMTFPTDEDGKASDIFGESGGKIFEAYRKDGENYAVIHYLCPNANHPLATGKFFEVTE